MDRTRARGSVTGGCGHVIELLLPSRDDLDLRADCIAIALRALQREFQPVVARGAVVDPDLCWSADSGHNKVEFSVMIEVPEGGATMPYGRPRGEPSLLSQCGPFPARHVAKGRIGLIDLTATGHCRRLHISATDKNILPAVVVEVGNVRAVPRHWVAQKSHPAFFRDLGKSAFR